jgi:hypothetical protein
MALQKIDYAIAKVCLAVRATRVPPDPGRLVFMDLQRITYVIVKV